MSDFTFEIDPGSSVTLLTAGKYCTDNIVVSASGGSGGGGSDITIPTGFAIERGIYIPESNISSAVTIDLKNTFRWADTGKESACYLLLVAVDLLTGVNAAGLGAHVKFGVGERNHQMVQTTSGCSTSTTIFINPKTTTTFNQITITGTSTYALKKGVAYLWEVIGELAS